MRKNYENKSTKIRLVALALCCLMLLVPQLSFAGNSFIGKSVIEKIVTDSTISINVKNSDMRNILYQIQEKARVNIIYVDNEIDKLTNIDYKADNETIKAVLNDLLSSRGYEYVITDAGVSISKSAAKATQPEKRERKIKGKVINESGKPIFGAVVLIKGTTRGAITDDKGDFILSGIGTNQELEFSCMGYNEHTMIPKSDNITVKMIISAQQIDDVVVTGYQTISKERATGSFVSLSGAELLKERPGSNVKTMLEGKLSGVTFDTGGNIIMRGQVGLDNDDANYQPLIIVDGFEITPSRVGGLDSESVSDVLARYNPNDIENISLLKDAASASIWGAKAANGVLVITTKNGSKSGKGSFSYNGSLTLQQHPNYNDNPYQAGVSSMLWLEDFAVNTHNYGSLPSPYYSSSPNSWIRQAYMDLKDNSLSAEAHATAQGKIDAATALEGKEYDEYMELFCRMAVNQNHNISFSQGSDKGSFHASVNYSNDIPMNIGSKSNSFTANFNTRYEVFKGVTLKGKSNVRTSNTVSSPVPSWQGFNVTQPILDSNGNYINQPYGLFQSDKDTFEAMGATAYDWDYNLLREQRSSESTNNATNIDFQAGIEVKLLEGLTLDATYNYITNKYNSQTLYGEDSWEVRNGVNDSAIFYDHDDAWDTPLQHATHLAYSGFIIPQGSQIKHQSVNESSSNSYKAVLSFNRYLDAAQKHYVSALAGMDYREVIGLSTNPEDIYGYDERTLTTLPVDYNTKYQSYYGGSHYMYREGLSYYKTHDRYLSNYFNASYAYDNKYTVSGSWRLDDSNLFGSSPEYRNVPLYSMGGKWAILREEFMKDIDFMTRLDLRASYGTGGNINKSVSPYLTITKSTNNFNGIPYASIRNYPNEQLRWETTATTNIAVDFGFFDNSLTGSIEYYSRLTDDQLFMTSVDPVNGYGSLQLNYASVKNSGVDINLNYNKEIAEGLNWNISLNHSFNKNMIMKVESTVNSYFKTYFSQPNIEGEPISGIYSYKWAGLNENGAPQIYDGEGNVISYEENMEDELGLVYSGQTAPKWYGNLSNSFSYKDITLNFMISYQGGNVFRKQSYTPPSSLSYSSITSLPHIDFENRWQKAGDEKITDIPAYNKDLTYGNYVDYYSYADINVLNAAYISLDYIGLQYNLTKSRFKWLPFNNANAGFNMSNLGMLWVANDEGINPKLGNHESAILGKPIYSFSLSFNL